MKEWRLHQSHCNLQSLSRLRERRGRYWLFIPVDPALRQTYTIASHSWLTVLMCYSTLSRNFQTRLCDPYQNPKHHFQFIRVGKENEAMDHQTLHVYDTTAPYVFPHLLGQRQGGIGSFISCQCQCLLHLRWTITTSSCSSKSIKSRFVIPLSTCSFYNEISISKPFLTQKSRFLKANLPRISR